MGTFFPFSFDKCHETLQFVIFHPHKCVLQLHYSVVIDRNPTFLSVKEYGYCIHLFCILLLYLLVINSNSNEFLKGL